MRGRQRDFLADALESGYRSGMSINKFPPKPKYDPDTGRSISMAFIRCAPRWTIPRA